MPFVAGCVRQVLLVVCMYAVFGVSVVVCTFFVFMLYSAVSVYERCQNKLERGRHDSIVFVWRCCCARHSTLYLGLLRPLAACWHLPKGIVLSRDDGVVMPRDLFPACSQADQME